MQRKPVAAADVEKAKRLLIDNLHRIRFRGSCSLCKKLVECRRYLTKGLEFLVDKKMGAFTVDLQLAEKRKRPVAFFYLEQTGESVKLRNLQEICGDSLVRIQVGAFMQAFEAKTPPNGLVDVQHWTAIPCQPCLHKGLHLPNQQVATCAQTLDFIQGELMHLMRHDCFPSKTVVAESDQFDCLSDNFCLN
jgi:hypothetical protein